MLNTKFNLYNPGWIEIVFNDRNKAYGAYELRNRYAGNMIKAMCIAFTTIIVVAWLLSTALGHKSDTIERSTIVILPPMPVIVPQKKIEPPKPVLTKQTPPAATQKFTSFTITDKPVKEDPPKITELTGAISNQTVKGDPGEINIPIDNGTPGTGKTVTPPTPEVYYPGSLEVEPQPVGGMAAFSKFLGKKLRFPSAAAEQGVQGKCILSFVIEKDGHLSNIMVEREEGYGFDEEALRVLKLAKNWKPGIQNGQPVRVKYTIPINFQLPE